MVIIDQHAVDLLIEAVTEACDGRLELVEIEDIVDRILVQLQKKGFKLVSYTTEDERDTHRNQA